MTAKLPLIGLGALLAWCWQRSRPQPARAHAGRAHAGHDAAALAPRTQPRPATAAAPALPAGDSAHFAGLFDAITGLPNESALAPMLDSMLELTRLRGARCALVRIDLLGLDIIRSIAGASAGESVLRTIAGRLVAASGGEALSLGRGSFAVVLTPDHDAPHVLRATNAMLEQVHQQIQLGDLPVALRCRAGIALYPEHASGAGSLVRAADMACAAAHERNTRSLLYSSGLEPDPRSLTLLADLADAIESGTLGYELQPKLDLVLDRFTGAEVLVRWRHPTYGALSPCDFVPLAEKMGLVGDMSRYLLQRAARHCREWRAAGVQLTLSVNLSVNDLAEEDLVDALIADAQDLDGALTVEVTETAAMHDPITVLAAVGRLHAHGVRISLDDFGTGYSSLTYLQRLAPDELKIDRSFISRLLLSRSDRAIVRTSIQLAHDLGASVIAEGIEDDEVLGWLTEAGCDAAQGFAIARPMPVEDLLRSRFVHTLHH